ncbi:hypothetical protein V6N13_081078 [Hibiscus sabdariffa]|uniref:Uncharacterized protein n=1 Tax=Hibiscus sabdariffa TaxID=183260 RepID=A0ABR2DBG5_9ROSI
MSNSELILVKDEIEFDILKRPPLEFEGTAIYNSSDDPEADDEEKTGGEESNVKAAASKENTCFDDDDDGFKTPTCFDQKIPEMKQCPAAPRKPKATKRRNTCGNLQLDLSQVVESWFLDLHRRVKKARTQDN